MLPNYHNNSNQRDNSNHLNNSNYRKDPHCRNNSHVGMLKRESSSGPSIIKIESQHKSSPTAERRRITTAAKKIIEKAVQIKAEDEVDAVLDMRNFSPPSSNDKIIALETERSQLRLTWVNTAIKSAIGESREKSGEAEEKSCEFKERDGELKEKIVQSKEYENPLTLYSINTKQC
jgi:hypothetical protein